MAEEKCVQDSLLGKFIVRRISGTDGMIMTGTNEGREKSETNGVEVKKTSGTANI